MSSVEVKDFVERKKRLQIIRGIPIFKFFKPEILEEVLDYVPHDDDVQIATYPKTGTTWMQYIVLQILTNGESFPDFNEMLEKAVPYLEMVGVAALDSIKTRPRVCKHHFSYDAIKSNPKSKIIYVYRKPEDTCVSMYHFNKNLFGPTDFEEFFEDFLAGDVAYGRYFEHVLSYLKHKDDGNILFVSYEKLCADRKGGILKVAKFLGDDYYDNLLKNESALEKIVEQTNFTNMKKNLKLYMPEDKTKSFAQGEPKREVLFFRKGTVGDGKDSLTEDQVQRLRNLACEVMKGTEILKEWYSE